MAARFLVDLLAFALLGCLWWPPDIAAAGPPPLDRLLLSGVIRDSQGRELKDVRVEVTVEGKPLTAEGGEIITGRHGSFAAEFMLPAGTLPATRVDIKARKPGFVPLSARFDHLVEARREPSGSRVFQASQVFIMERRWTPAAWIAAGTLVAVYALITADWLHRTLAASLGAAVILFISYTAGTFNEDFFVLSFEDAVSAIDMNVILLLLGMMVMVAVLKKSGLFRWLAYQAYALARGRVLFLVVFLMLFTAAASAFIDNVTVMLLVIPVTIEIAVPLKVNPTAFLIPEVFAANLGGTASLIGDPPNLLIGSYAKLSFVDFLANLGGIVLVCLLVSAIYYFFWYRPVYRRVFDLDFGRTLDFLKREYRIRDQWLLVTSLIILAAVLALFLVHHLLGMPPAVAALVGAISLLALSRQDIASILEKEVEWPTLLFLIALFILIEGTRASGVTQTVADRVAQIAQGNVLLALTLVLWLAVLASCLVETVAFTAAMLPIVSHLTGTIPGAETGVLWWALALGASLGGNGTLMGAAANVVTVGLAEKAGYRISFLEYSKSCFIPMVITVLLAMAYLVAAF